jgi:hypothetical protein
MPGVLREHWRQFAGSRAGTVLVYASLAVNAIATSVLLGFVASLTPSERAAVLITSLVAWVVLIALGWTRGTLPLRPVVAVIVLTLGLAVATPSYQSKDVFSYAMYGRIVTVHHSNPYNSYPMHFEGDPMRRPVSAVWQRTPDIYGPAFTVVMSAFAPVIGESTFLARFLYQMVSLAAVGALLWLMWRRTRSPVVLAFIGIHPIITVSVVNGGHPDALIALAFMVAFLLALERRVALCGAALAFAVAINFSVLVGAVALGAWAYRRWTRTEVAKLAAIVAGFGALPYLFLNGWMQNAREHQQLISRQSVWNPLEGWLGAVSIDTAQVRQFMPNATTLAAGALLLVVLWRYTNGRTPALAMAAAIAVFVVTSPWVMPWYAFAAFPFLALRRPNAMTWAVAIYSGLILVGDQYPTLSAKSIGSFGHTVYETIVPVVACAVCVVAIVRSRVDDAPAPAAPSFAAMPAVPAR